MTNRKTTTQELLDRFEGAIENLALNCARFAAHVASRQAEMGETESPFEVEPVSKVGIVSDIAAQLRTLLLPGQGNSLLARVAAQAAEPKEPTFSIGSPARLPDHRYSKLPKTHTAIGALPDGIAASELTIEKFLDVVCVALIREGFDPVEMTWSDLIKQVADKLGAHVDGDRPVVWDHMNSIHIGLVPTISFLLYRIALLVIEEGNDLLQAAGRQVVSSSASPSLGGLQANAMIATEWTRRPHFNVKSNDACPCRSGKKWKRCHRLSES